MLKLYLYIMLICFATLPIKYGSAATLAEQLIDLSENEQGDEINDYYTERIKSKVNFSQTQTSVLSKTIRIKISELKDNSGLVYLGGVVSKAELSPYLEQLSKLLGGEFAAYRHNQSVRDHNIFHLTLVNPYEYQTLNKSTINLNQAFTVSLLGLATVSMEGKTTYYVVAQSSEAQFFRQQLILQPKDFHVTLGFNPQDIYGVGKGRATLITQ